MIFQEIYLHNFTRPLMERAASRKFTGPYRWTPTQPGKGRGFYQASGHGLACGDSTFSLRLEYANDHLSDHGYGSLRRIDGYYTDSFQDGTLTPIIARLPHGRGYLAGWTMGPNMAASLDATIHTDIEDAARAAHSIADSDAECERDYQKQHNDNEDSDEDE